MTWPPHFAVPRARDRLYVFDKPAKLVVDGDGRIVSYANLDGETFSREGLQVEMARIDADEKAAATAQADANLERRRREGK